MRRPYYGVLLAPTIVLAIYAGQHASPYELVRPIVVLTMVGAGAFVIVGVVSHRWHAAALVASFVLLALVAVQFCLLLIPWLAFATMSKRHTGSWGVAPRLTYPLNALVTAWFAIAVVTAVAISLPQRASASAHATVPPGPNVYLIWLDGYPRDDSLLEYFDFDNTPFLSALEARGFVVSRQSRTLYPSSIQTMATMLQGRPLEDLIGGEWTGSHEQYRQLWWAINDAPLPAAYEAAGYRTYSIISPVLAHDWRTADVVLDSPWLSFFEDHVLSQGLLRTILPFYAMHRADILDALRYLRESAGTSPRFVFAHILKPHDPYVFAADGSPAKPCGRECENHAGPPNPVLGDRLTGQIQWLNDQVLSALDEITSTDPEAVVVVFSDHGLRRDRNDMDEWFRTLFAARGAHFSQDVATSDLLDALTPQIGTAH